VTSFKTFRISSFLSDFFLFQAAFEKPPSLPFSFSSLQIQGNAAKTVVTVAENSKLIKKTKL
jgi:hypothetical protein